MSTEESTPGSEKDVDLTRRALIQAGWVIPAVIAVKLPTNAFAQYVPDPPTGGTHSDTAHSDTVALGQHVDSQHIDATL